MDPSFYTDRDRKFWERINQNPNYPGTGEGNLLVRQMNNGYPRRALERDRRAFGSLTFLFATPPDFGPLNGRALSSLRANLVYRFYTGTPFVFTPVVYDPQTGRNKAGATVRKNGPIHTRMDLNLEKRFGNPSKLNLTLALEIFNLFNQKDPRSVRPNEAREIDFDPERWNQWGIQGLNPISVDFFRFGEINDVNNYWDRPRALTFSVRIKW
ncbi:MAG: hypothetical protein QF675_10235 [SAR324 cluster bacterium]|nr:hypothetical protein [SAR324 cluster bacterium]